MQYIFNIGIQSEMEKYLADKIQISNKVALLMALVGVCYTGFSYFYYPPLTIYPAFCILFSIGAIALNYLGLYNVSRFFLSTLVLLLAYLYHAFLVQPGEDIIPSMIVIEFTLSVIPWVLIDFRERTLLTVSVVGCYVLIFSQPWANEILSIELDSSLFRSGFLNTASYGFGVLILVSCLFFMQHTNFIFEVQNEKLLDDINSQNAEMDQQKIELENHLLEIELARAQEEKQNWVSKGIADISEIMRQDNDGDIQDEIVTAIVKYIDANQGCMFMVNETDVDDIHLEMTACYAYDRKKHFSKRIEVGQGLIGQCYLEKETIKLKDVPKDFVNITSGLGEDVPSFVAIVPILHDIQVVGVMEFALFRDLEDYQIEFLEKLGHNIASFFLANSMNIKTRELLNQSQMQMEQLRAQEEEMRQNMEELQATQEEMQRKEKEYIERISELEKGHEQTPS
jgi:predicted transcriptional regulator